MRWPKTKFVYDLSRSIHYRVRHASPFTNHRLSKFTETSENCQLCCLSNRREVEDNAHVFLHCIRARKLFAITGRVLKNISGRNEIAPASLVLGQKLHDWGREVCFNFVIQNMQRAIWISRCNFDFD